jgi:hypothetical protein
MHCGLSDKQAIEDAYPCTPLQKGLMALAVKQPGSYLTAWVYKLSRQVDLLRFKDAWERTVALCGGLRTRIITLADGETFQIVVDDDFAWDTWDEPFKSMEDDAAALTLAIEQTHKTDISTGSRLWRYALSGGTDRQKYFTLIGHHAVFDGWSVGLIIEQLQSLY